MWATGCDPQQQPHQLPPCEMEAKQAYSLHCPKVTKAAGRHPTTANCRYLTYAHSPPNLLVQLCVLKRSDMKESSGALRTWQTHRLDTLRGDVPLQPRSAPQSHPHSWLSSHYPCTLCALPYFPVCAQAVPPAWPTFPFPSHPVQL